MRTRNRQGEVGIEGTDRIATCCEYFSPQRPRSRATVIGKAKCGLKAQTESQPAVSILPTTPSEQSDSSRRIMNFGTTHPPYITRFAAGKEKLNDCRDREQPSTLLLKSRIHSACMQSHTAEERRRDAVRDANFRRGHPPNTTSG